MVIRLALVLALATGCAMLPPPRTIVRTGPAAVQSIHRVLALPATCGTLDPQRHEDGQAGAELGCARERVRGADELIRSAIDFHGVEIIDAEQTNAVTALRHERFERHDGTASTSSSTVGELYADATPLDQAEILRELAADGVLTTRIAVGTRTVAVQVRLTRVDRVLVWVRRCELATDARQESGAWLELAARCAAEAKR